MHHMPSHATSQANPSALRSCGGAFSLLPSLKHSCVRFHRQVQGVPGPSAGTHSARSRHCPVRNEGPSSVGAVSHLACSSNLGVCVRAREGLVCMCVCVCVNVFSSMCTHTTQHTHACLLASVSSGQGPDCAHPPHNSARCGGHESGSRLSAGSW